MFKRKKDGGFTLIELMIVIAVIGILAVVLVPKMSNVKASAKATGVTTNAKSVEMFVIANIDKWIEQNGADYNPTTVIVNEFKDGVTDELKNPFNGATGASTETAVGAFSVAAAPYKGEGVVTVTIPDDLTEGITITGYGSSDTDKVYENEVKPN